jgi:hypothetical protein
MNITTVKVERVVARRGSTVMVESKPRSQTLRVVQSASPVPLPAGDVADPGDLTLIFDNKLI